MFKRILLTAVLGAGLVLTVPLAAEADHRDGRDRDRKDWGIRLPGLWGHHPGLYGSGSYGGGSYGGGSYGGGAYGAPAYPNLHFRGFDRHPDLYWYPAGFGAGRSYLGGGYYPGTPLLANVFGDDYYITYGYRCNGYRDGYYYGPDGDRLDFSGRAFYRRNADCENYFHRYGRWYGFSDCSRFEVEKGHCDDHDRR